MVNGQHKMRAEVTGRHVFIYIWVIEREWRVGNDEGKSRGVGSKCVGVRKKEEEVEVLY